MWRFMLMGRLNLFYRSVFLVFLFVCAVELKMTYQAYSIPVKLKYDCPAPSKFGKDLPLWKTATSCFLSIVKESTHRLHSFGQGSLLNTLLNSDCINIFVC